MTEHIKQWPVSEIFGPVLQGEGLLIGQPTHFVRFGGCDYRCNWCDSLYAVDPINRASWAKMAVAEITKALLDLGGDRDSLWVTLSGGNPALHDLSTLVVRLQGIGYRVAVETQGTMAPKWLADVDHLCLSPKPPSAGPTAWALAAAIPRLRLIIDERRKATNHRGGPRVFDPAITVLKMVVFTAEDFDFAQAIRIEFPTVPCVLQAGTVLKDDIPATREQVLDGLRTLGDWVLESRLANVAVLPQLHTLIHGQKRGV